MFGDFQAFIDSGQALAGGHYTSLYPLPAVILFAILALLPWPVGLSLVLGGSVTLLVALTGRKAPLWIFFAPILESFALGQLSLVWLWLARRASPWSLALLTLKPHLFPLALPSLIHDRRLWKPFAFFCILIYAPAFLIRPAWPVEWLAQVTDDGRLAYGTSASLLAVAWLAPIALAAISQFLAWSTVWTSFNPAMRAYDYTMLAGSATWLIPLSWLAIAAMWLTRASWPMAGIGLAYAFVAKHEQPVTAVRFA